MVILKFKRNRNSSDTPCIVTGEQLVNFINTMSAEPWYLQKGLALQITIGTDMSRNKKNEKKKYMYNNRPCECYQKISEITDWKTEGGWFKINFRGLGLIGELDWICWVEWLHSKPKSILLFILFSLYFFVFFVALT